MVRSVSKKASILTASYSDVFRTVNVLPVTVGSRIAAKSQCGWDTHRI